MPRAREPAPRLPRSRICRSQKVKVHLDRHAHGKGLAIRAKRGLEAPVANRFLGFLVEAEAETLGDVNVRRAAVDTNDCSDDHRSLHFRFYGFVSEFGVRAVRARRKAVAIQAARDTVARAIGIVTDT